MGKNNKYLYHYTNVESLALILKNQTIRFRSLDKLDDLQEAEFADGRNISKYCFVSSWTSLSDESIPMWKMYSNPQESAIRIQLKKFPFETYELDKCDADPLWWRHIKIEPGLRSLFQKTEFFNDYQMTPLFLDQILHKVSYTNNADLLKPQIIYPNNEMQIATNNMGKFKNEIWKFQEEWRYILTFLPVSYQESVINPPEKVFNKTANAFKDGAPLPFQHLDLKIEDDAFNEMIITTGPNISQGHRVIINSLLKTYNPNIKVVKSLLEDKIR